MRLFFRLDASPSMGLGHARRCAVLARAAQRQGAETVFFVRSQGLTREQLGFPRGSAVDAVPWDIDPVEEAGFLPELCARHGTDCGVIDHYRQTVEYQRRLADSGIRWMQFSNASLQAPLGGDLLHDASPGARLENYTRDRFWRGEREPLFGPSFALVSEAFTRERARARPMETRSKTLLTFGGGADRKAAIASLDWLDTAGWPGQRVVLSTSLNPNLPALRRRCDQSDLVTLVQDNFSPAATMAECRAALCAGGTTLYELATLGVPALIVTIADNQVGPAKSWEREAFGVYLGDLDTLDSSHTVSRLRELAADTAQLHECALRSHAAVDGKGAGRTATRLLRLAGDQP